MEWSAALADWIDQDWVGYLLVPGLLAAIVAVFAWRGDRSRMTRSNPDAVGIVPWRDLAFWSAFAAVLLLGAAGRAWLKS